MDVNRVIHDVVHDAFKHTNVHIGSQCMLKPVAEVSELGVGKGNGGRISTCSGHGKAPFCVC